MTPQKSASKPGSASTQNPRSASTPRALTYIPLTDLKPHPENPKQHAEDLISASLSKLGVIDQITRDDRTGYIISGHGRAKALLTAYTTGQEPPEGVHVTDDGVWMIPVITGWSSRDDDHARAALITLNTLTEAGGWEDTSFLDVLRSLQESDAELLALTGKDDGFITDLAHILEPDYVPVSAHERRLDSLDPKPCPKCGYDTVNDPDGLRVPR